MAKAKKSKKSAKKKIASGKMPKKKNVCEFC